jgi:hypothetical protein
MRCQMVLAVMVAGALALLGCLQTSPLGSVDGGSSPLGTRPPEAGPGLTPVDAARPLQQPPQPLVPGMPSVPGLPAPGAPATPPSPGTVNPPSPGVPSPVPQR